MVPSWLDLKSWLGRNKNSSRKQNNTYAVLYWREKLLKVPSLVTISVEFCSRSVALSVPPINKILFEFCQLEWPSRISERFIFLVKRLSGPSERQESLDSEKALPQRKVPDRVCRILPSGRSGRLHQYVPLARKTSTDVYRGLGWSYSLFPPVTRIAENKMLKNVNLRTVYSCWLNIHHI